MVLTDYHGFLNPNDPVAISFWIISISMVASTVFFLMESRSVATKWKTSLNVGALVTLVAGVHYFYMREFWITIHSSPILYRYIDWSITVPLQMIEFYLILSAVQPGISGGIFWRLLIGTVVMLAAGYAGESGFLPPGAGFTLGMMGWFFILFEIFGGEASSVAASGDNVNKHVQAAFSTMRFIVTVGWSIYPLGYFFGYLQGSVQDSTLNLVYNLADFVNKIAFCLAIWHSAKNSTMEQGHSNIEALSEELGKKMRETERLMRIAQSDPTDANIKAARAATQRFERLKSGKPETATVPVSDEIPKTTTSNVEAIKKGLSKGLGIDHLTQAVN